MLFEVESEFRMGERTNTGFLDKLNSNKNTSLSHDNNHAHTRDAAVQRSESR